MREREEDERGARTSRRASLASLLDALGAVDAALAMRRMMRLPFLPILTYHRIQASRSPDAFDDGVVDATAEQFDRQVATLSRSFHLIGTKELDAYMRREEELPPNPAMITFDDGYRECRDVVLPILQRHHAKATFFIATSFVEERRVFWWDAISYVVKRSKRRELLVDHPVPDAYSLVDGERARTIERLGRIVKERHGLDVPRFVDAVARAADVPFGGAIEQELASELVLTWDDVRALHRAGMDVQSHTRTHRILETVPPEDLDSELAGSRRDLEGALDAPVMAIAYPVGGQIETNPLLCSAVAMAGYRLGFSNGSGTNLLSANMHPLGIRRVVAPGELPNSFFRATIAFPSFGYHRSVRRTAVR
jgi:peptidoglycan/xylan/chitin deacetylase (PgdA/CDA1 family)